jgi:PAS domain S-box-containing protein
MIDHKALFNAMPVPRLLIRPGEKGDFIVEEVNQRTLEYFNCKEDHIIGYSVGNFMDSENARHFEQSFEVSLKQKVPVSIQALPSFPGGLRVYGFWINPLLDASGKVILLDVMAQPDSSDDSILQRERDDAISLLTSIFDASDIGIIVTDHNRRIIRVNDSFVRTYHWARDHIIGEDFLSLVSPDEQEQIKDNHDNYLRNGLRSSGEMKLIKYDGSVVNTLFTSATLELSQRRKFLVTTIMNITLRKQMEISLRLAKEQADAANYAKSAFLANMSHELRTPLNAIIGFSEMMMKETFGPLANPKYQEYLGDIHVSARHLLEIINEVLDMSKIEAGKLELDEQNMDMTEAIESVMRMMASRAFSGSIKMETCISPGLPALFADPRLIRQILINIVSNSVKFTKPGGRIDVIAETNADGDMVIRVEDTGIGIPKDKIKQALEPFGQIHDSAHAAKEIQGTGLGLPLAKAMIELHGGHLGIDSDTDQGTRVAIYFPSHRVVPFPHQNSVN